MVEGNLRKQFIKCDTATRALNRKSIKPEKAKTGFYTVEPRFNEVPRDWENLFVISKTSI